jgi:hypothetical protein
MRPLDVGRVQLGQRRPSCYILFSCRVVSEQCLQLLPVSCYISVCERGVTTQLGCLCSDVCLYSRGHCVPAGDI